MKKGTQINDTLVASTKGTMLGFIRGEVGNYDIDTWKVLPAYYYAKTYSHDIQAMQDELYSNDSASGMRFAKKTLLVNRKGEIAAILQETRAGSQVHLELAKECCLFAAKEQATTEKPSFLVQVDNGLFYAGFFIFANSGNTIEMAGLFSTLKEGQKYLVLNTEAAIVKQKEISVYENELEQAATKLSEHIELQELNLLQDAFENEMLFLAQDKGEISANDLVSSTMHSFVNDSKLPNACLSVSEKEALIKELLPNIKEKYALHKVGISGAYFAPLPNVDKDDLRVYLDDFRQLHTRVSVTKGLSHIFPICANPEIYIYESNGLFRAELETSTLNTAITAPCRFKAAFELLSIYYHYGMSIKHDLAEKWHFIFEEWLIRITESEFSSFIKEICTIDKISLQNGKHYYRCKLHYNGKKFLSLDYSLLEYRVLREYILAILVAKDKSALELEFNLLVNIITSRGNLFHVTNKILP